MNFGPLRRSLAGALAILVFTTQSLFAYSPEKSFWESRRTASGQRPALLNPLPENLLGSQTLDNGLAQEFSRHIPASILRGRESVFAALRRPSVTLRGASAGGAADRPTVVYIQDVHRNAEAQARIGEAVGAMLETGQVGLLALEGTAGPINITPFRSFPNQRAVAEAADHLFKDSKVSGAVRAALKAAAAPPPLVGVEDPAHYRANVEAYRRSAPRMEMVRRGLADERVRLAGEKVKIFSPALRKLDDAVLAYREKRSALGDYIDGLAAAAPPPPAVRAFMEVLAMERRMDFAAVERERVQLAEKLAQRLAPAALQALTEQGLAYRSGQLGEAAFYGYLANLCREANLALDQVPAMAGYIRYVQAADRLAPQELFRGLADLEARAYSRLVVTPAEKVLVKAARLNYLTGRLAEFGLTPEEWEEYAQNKPSGAHLDSFEAFYHEAHERDGAMARNLLSSLQSSGARTAVLVAGGFHAEGLTKALEEAGVAVVTVAPRLEKIEDGASYLTVFAQEKTPLEKLFSPEKIYLAPDPFNGPAELALRAVVTDQVAPDAPGPVAREQIQTFLNRVMGRVVDFDVLETTDDPRGVRVRFEGEVLEFLRTDGGWTLKVSSDRPSGPGSDRLLGIAALAILIPAGLLAGDVDSVFQLAALPFLPLVGQRAAGWRDRWRPSALWRRLQARASAFLPPASALPSAAPTPALPPPAVPNPDAQSQAFSRVLQLVTGDRSPAPAAAARDSVTSSRDDLPWNYLMLAGRNAAPPQGKRSPLLTMVGAAFKDLDEADAGWFMQSRFAAYRTVQKKFHNAFYDASAPEGLAVVLGVLSVVLIFAGISSPTTVIWGQSLPLVPGLALLTVLAFGKFSPRAMGIIKEPGYPEKISSNVYLQDPMRSEAMEQLVSVFTSDEYDLQFVPNGSAVYLAGRQYGNPDDAVSYLLSPSSGRNKGTITLVYDPARVGGPELVAGALQVIGHLFTPWQRFRLVLKLRGLRAFQSMWQVELARQETRRLVARLFAAPSELVRFSSFFAVPAVRFDWDRKTPRPAVRLRSLTISSRLKDPIAILDAVAAAFESQVMKGLSKYEREAYQEQYLQPLAARRAELVDLLGLPRGGRKLARLAGAALVGAWLVAGDSPRAADLAGLPVLAMLTDRLEDLATRLQSVLGRRSSPRAPPVPASEPASGKPLSPEKLSLELFTRHTDGLSMASTISQLNRPVPATGRSVFDVLAGRAEPISIARLIAETGLPENADGHLHAAFYYLEKQGWLQRAGPDGHNKLTVLLTPEGRQFVKAAAAYDAAAEFIATSVTGKEEAGPLTFGRWRERLLSEGPVGSQFSKLLELSARGWDIPAGIDPAAAEMVRKHLDGVIVSTLMIGLQYDGEEETLFWERLRDGNASLAELAAVSSGWSEARLAPVLKFLAGERLGFAAENGAGWGLTGAGKMAAKRVWGFGVPLSYFPTYGRMNLLMGGQPLLPGTIDGTELHVWRDVNAKGSGGSHIVYFDNMTEQSIQAFNHPDIDRQPQGILDIGCGDGESLRTQIRRIMNETERGRMIKAEMARRRADPNYIHDHRYDLRVIGVDLFPESRQITTANLRKDGVPTVLMGEGDARDFERNLDMEGVAALVLRGDVSNPAEFSRQLRGLGLNPDKLVWTSTMLIHDRKLQLGNRFLRPIRRLIARWRWAHAGVSLDDGAFIDEDTGRPVTNLEVLDDLYRHFKNYSEYVRRFGYYFVDLHYPAMAVPGRTFFSYMVNHSHAGQYTVPIRYYQLVADQLGLTLDIFKAIPSNPEMATVGIYRLYEKEAANDPDGGSLWKGAAVWLLTAITALVAFVVPASPAKLAGEDLRSFGLGGALPPVQRLGVESLDGRTLGRVGRRFAENPLYAQAWAQQVDTLAHAHVVLMEDLPRLEAEIALLPENAERPLAIVLIPGANDRELFKRLQALTANRRVSVLMPEFGTRTAWLSPHDVTRWAEGKGRVAWMATRNPAALHVSADPRGAPSAMPPIFTALIEVLKTAPPISRVDFDLLRRVTRAILSAA